jgi:hypothetical protein
MYHPAKVATYTPFSLRHTKKSSEKKGQNSLRHRVQTEVRRTKSCTGAAIRSWKMEGVIGAAR